MSEQEQRRGAGWVSSTELGQHGAEGKDCTAHRPYHPVQTFREGRHRLGPLCDSHWFFTGMTLPPSGGMSTL